jgi:hypothetical protein
MNYDVYFHNDFDGRAAAAVVLAFLRSRGDNIEHFVPVKYDIIPEWLDEHFFAKNKLFHGKHNPAIVVDFPYHPQAVFWFDHHIRPFRKPGWEKKFKPSAGRRYDDSYRSACHLAYDSLRRDFGWKPPTHLRELVKWLNVIDFADYKSARQTIEMKEAAIQANVYIENGGDAERAGETVQFLAARPLAQFVKTPRVKKIIARMRRNMAASIRFHEKNIKIDGRVMVIDLAGDKTDDLAYFAPYFLYPKMLYTVRFHAFPGRPSLYHINVAVNPWLRAQNHKNIGEFLKRHGGGGHKDVGGAEIEGRAATLKIVQKAIKFLNAKD